MERVAPIIFALLVAALSTSCQPPKGSGTAVTSSTGLSALLGPDSFPFCDGWVELWIQAERYAGVELRIKVSPPANATWKVWNAHAVVEHVSKPDHPLRFLSVTDYDSSDSKTNVVSMPLDMEGMNPADGIKVALRPFEGCDKAQKMRGVVLKRSIE